MYLLFLLFWILLNGKFTLEIFLFGLLISAAVFAFCCRFMGYSIQKDFLMFRKSGLFLAFCGLLVKEIAIANMNVLKLIYSPKLQPEPAVVYFKTDLKTDVCRVLLANSITLTPGTMTVSIEEDEFCVHCLDRSFGEGIEECSFVQVLRKMEGAKK